METLVNTHTHTHVKEKKLGWSRNRVCQFKPQLSTYCTVAVRRIGRNEREDWSYINTNKNNHHNNNHVRERMACALTCFLNCGHFYLNLSFNALWSRPMNLRGLTCIQPSVMSSSYQKDLMEEFIYILFFCTDKPLELLHILFFCGSLKWRKTLDTSHVLNNSAVF